MLTFMLLLPSIDRDKKKKKREIKPTTKTDATKKSNKKIKWCSPHTESVYYSNMTDGKTVRNY